VTWEEYGRNLEANLKDLHGRIHRERIKRYHQRRVWIPKGEGRQRPLGIAALEDKNVQHAVGTVPGELSNVATS
jgi:RNA-directed DNA polymerase